MTKNLSPRVDRGNDRHENEQPVDTPRTENQVVTSFGGNSQVRLVCHSRPFARNSSMAATDCTHTTASREGEKLQESAEKSPEQDTHQGTDDEDDEEEKEEDNTGENEKYDENDKGALPHSREAFQASFSANLTALNKEWNQSLTKQLYAHHLSNESQHVARFNAQRRAAEMQYPEFLPLQRSKTVRGRMEDAKDTP
ncbi:hypothetical protein E4U21_001718 [Claviceps maximensis]|nr:hypothetical protein E4U21_001718 [Claviceps maximensis]